MPSALHCPVLYYVTMYTRSPDDTRRLLEGPFRHRISRLAQSGLGGAVPVDDDIAGKQCHGPRRLI